MTHSVVQNTAPCNRLRRAQMHGAGAPWAMATCPPPVPELAHPAPCDRHLQLLQVRALFGHHSSQELVLEPVPGDQEVDQGALGLHLGLVVWVEVLGVQDQAELSVVLHLLVADLDESGGQCRKGLEGLPVAGGGNTTETTYQSARGPVPRPSCHLGPSSGYWEGTSVASLALVPFSGPRRAHPEDEPALPLAGWLTQPGCMSCSPGEPVQKHSAWAAPQTPDRHRHPSSEHQYILEAPG